jgi:phytoene dehydrogenase-like protein
MSAKLVVVVGGGHNGLVAACYLAKAGRRVLVIEAADKPGGGSRTSGHIVPGVSGLFTCGASTAPAGGIAGSSGKAAALQLVKAQP